MLSAPCLRTQAALESITAHMGCVCVRRGDGREGGPQREAERPQCRTLAANLIFISYLMNTARSRALCQELLFISTSPKLRLSVMFTSKRQPIGAGNDFTFFPQKKEVLGIELHTLLGVEVSLILQREASNGFGYFGSFEIRDPVFHPQVYPS